MVSDTSDVISVILGIFAVVSLVTSLVAFARAGLAKSTIETLQQSNAALSERVDLLEAENARDKADLLRLEAENEVLKGIVGASDAIERLGVTIAVQYETLHEAIRNLR